MFNIVGMDAQASLKTQNSLTTSQHFAVTSYNRSVPYIFLNY